jgi:hypothetical protein
MGGREGKAAPGTVPRCVSIARQRFGPGQVELAPFPLRTARTLEELSDDFAFFTLGPLYYYTQFHDGPITDFLAETKQEAKFYKQKFTVPLFSGMEHGEDPTFNHLLWAVSRPHWEVFGAFFTSIRVSDHHRQCLWGIGYHPLVIDDPIGGEGLVYPGRLSRKLTIGVFGVTAPEGRLLIVPGKPPRLTWFDPDPAIVAYQSAFFKGKQEPFAHPPAPISQEGNPP